jgi:hypothetical protein
MSTRVMELKTKNGGKNKNSSCFPLPSVPNIELVLQHFHRCCYRSSPLWFFC